MTKFEEFLNEISKKPDLVSKLSQANDFDEFFSVFKDANINISQDELNNILKNFYISKNSTSEPQMLDDENLELISGGKINFTKVKALALASLLPLTFEAGNASAEVFKVSDVPAVSTSVKKKYGVDYYKRLLNSSFAQNVSTIGLQDVDVLKGAYLDKGADVNAKIEHKHGGWVYYDTILSEAFRALPVAHGADDTPATQLLAKFRLQVKYDVIKFLLEKGANPNIKLKYGNNTTTPFLQCIARCGEYPEVIPILDLLLKHGANINEQDGEGRTALAYPISSVVIHYLLEHGADANIKDNNGRTPKERNPWFRDALTKKCDYSEAIKRYSDIIPKDLSKEEISNALIKAVDLTVKSNYSGQYMVAIKRLLDRGGDATEALKDACAGDDGSGGSYRLANLLLKYGADPSEAIIYVCGHRYHPPKSAADRSIVVGGGENSTKVLELLINRGADVNKTSESGFSALMITAYNPANFKKSKLLIKHGADINFKLKEGTNALSVAKYNHNDKLEKLLIEKGAKT